MATQLAAQLAQIAANSRSSLNVKAQRAAHSKSLIFEPKEAASQSYQTLFALCHQGFEELCQLDSRFAPFQLTIFSEQSQHEDRTQLNAEQNAELDRRIESFLRLVGARLRLMPAIRALEWLIRRFRIHEFNTSILITTFLPYHTIPAFVTLMSILPSKIPAEFQFLRPYIQSRTAPPRTLIVHQSIHQPSFISLLSEYTLESCRTLQYYPELIFFWAGVVTEALNGMLDRMKSGRRATQLDNTQSVLHLYLPILSEALIIKKVPSIQISSYMAISILASKGDLDDSVLSAFMEQIVQGWTSETIRTGLVCLAILAQFRSAKQVSSKLAKALLKVENLGQHLVDIGRERRVDRLANGVCLASVERLCKKGDPRGLSVVKAVLLGQILKEKQATVIFKSLLLAAHRLNDEVDAEGKIRKELGSILIELSRADRPANRIIQDTLQATDFNIEELEMRLEISIRPRLLVAKNGDTDMAEALPEPAMEEGLELAFEKLGTQDNCLAANLSSDPGSSFNDFTRAFLSVVLNQIQDDSSLARFEQLRPLHRETAISECTYLSFLARVWCGPYPALAREAALNSAKSRLKDFDCSGTDFQALIPYCISALSDPSKKVRYAAAELTTVVQSLYDAESTEGQIWGAKSLYDTSEHLQWLRPGEAGRFLATLVVPALEECVLDEEHIVSALHDGLDGRARQEVPETNGVKKEHLSHTFRTVVLAFLASHALATPLLTVKERLLKTLNGVRAISKSEAAAQCLLVILRWWCALNETEATQLCEKEALDQNLLDVRFVDAAQPNHNDGLECLLQFVKAPETTRPNVTRTIFSRLRNIWPSMKREQQAIVARTMLDLSQNRSQESDNGVSEGAADLLRTIELSSDILLSFLDDLLADARLPTEPPPSKRRRTSSSDSRGSIGIQTSLELSAALRRATFIVQLVDGSNPSSHPELFSPLFSTVSEIQHLRPAVGSDLSYLQHLILRCLLAMMPTYKANKTLHIDSSRSHGDVLVKCIQQSSSPMVQNAAFLLIADLATIAPDLVIHSVMPIFTFMGGSVMRHSDDYSAHVVNQTIKEVLPPLIDAIRKGKRNTVAAASELLLSFTTAYEHVPSHRKQAVFMSLVETLGAQEFLFAIMVMLVDKYGSVESLVSFLGDILGTFTVEIQLETLVKWLDLINDLFKSKPGLSSSIFAVGDGRELKNAAQIAQPQLSVFSTMLKSKKLKKEIGKLADHDDMQAFKARELYAALLENILMLADTVKSDKALYDRCGSSLANLLNLLSIGEFVKAVESLLDRPNINLRQKVLKALEVRVEQESSSDAESRTTLLAFLPELTAAIRNTSDMKYKHTAVRCIDKIAEKYGKQDIEAVAAAASVIAGEHCLGQGDKHLRHMALICLASLVDVLQDGVIPILPVAIPLTLTYLQKSLAGNDLDEELHNAGYAFMAALAQHLPYVFSGAYLDRLLVVSNNSAEGRLDDDSDESRKQCLHFLAVQVDAKVIFGALEKNLPSAAEAGYAAIGEYLEILRVAIEKHTKASITKNVSHLSGIFMGVLDLRRQKQTGITGEPTALTRLAEIEAVANDVALKMIYKLNDATFRPVFSQLIDWASKQLSKQDMAGRNLRQQSVYGFLYTFFDSLKSIVTGYSLYIVDDAVNILKATDMTNARSKELWARVLKTLTKCFEHDQDDFWQAPSHFDVVAPVLVEQFLLAPATDLSSTLVPAVVELAAAADSQEHQKELNSAILKHLRSEAVPVRLAAVKAEQALTERLGEDWLAMLPEMLPYISELQEDDDEVVERETHRWIVLIEGVLGESLDSMLQ